MRRYTAEKRGGKTLIPLPRPVTPLRPTAPFISVPVEAVCNLLGTFADDEDGDSAELPSSLRWEWNRI